MKLITTLYILICCSVCSAQPYQWAIGEGGFNEDRAFGITTDNSGNVFVTGSFKSTATFGSVTFNNFSTAEDIFLVKYDSTGILLWAKQFGGTSGDIAYDVVADNVGNCYVTGTFYNQATFGAITLQSSGPGNYEAFVFKTNSAGTVLWAKRGGGVGFDESRGIALTGNKLYITGLFTGSATFGAATVTATGAQDVYITCYNLNGNVQWATSGGGAGSDFGLGVTSDATGNACVTGYFQGQATFGSSVLTNTSTVYIDMFVFKADTSGNILWARRGGGGGDDDAGRAIATDNAGNVYVAGELRGSGQFNSISYTSAGIADMYVAKYDASGNIQYLTQAGNQGGDYAYGIAAVNSRVYVTGLFNGIVQFGSTTLTSDGTGGPISNDIYLATIDANTGSFISAMRAGGIGDDAGRAVAMDNSGAVVQAGDFERDNSTFTPFTLNTNGTHDMFASRIAPPPCFAPTVSISATGATTFCQGQSVTLTASVTGTPVTCQWKKNGTNISGATLLNYTTTTTGIYTVQVTNTCSSATSNGITVTVNALPGAAITPAGPATFCSGGSVVLNTPVATNRTYQWKKGGTNIPGATLSSYTATIGGSYKVTVTNTVTGCSKTTATGTVVTVNPVPSATITPQGPVTFCAGGSVVLQANSGTGLTYQWKKGGNNINGATASAYTATIAGTYKVQVTNNNGCLKISSGVTVTVPCRGGEVPAAIGINVSVYPNPAHSEINIVLSSGDNFEIEIVNMLGESVIKEQNQNRIDITNLTNGMYFIKVTRGNSLVTQKFIRD